jgi:GNAT superfamily N-acetyltransferase
MSLEIRIATADDAAAACAILRRSIAECCVLDHKNDPAVLEAWLGNKTPDMVASWFASASNFAIVAVQGGEVLGVALLTRAGKVALCYLLPEVRGRGIGKALLERIEVQAAEWQIKALQLHSTASAERFFADHGYLASGTVRSPYGVDTTFFWKQLGAPVAGDSDKRKRFCNCNSAS